MKISCMQGRIESLLPPNVDPGSTLSSLNGAFIGGLTGSMLWFVTKYSRDYQALFTYDSVLRKKTLVAGARIAPFTDYEGCWYTSPLLPPCGRCCCMAASAGGAGACTSCGGCRREESRFLPMCCGHRSGIWCTALCCARCFWAFIISSGGS